VPYFPVFLDLAGRRCVVVGGGRVAGRKVNGLLKAGAKVTVISPSLSRGLNLRKEKNRIVHKGRSYRKGDLKGAFLAIAATDSEAENIRIARDAQRLNIPVNVVDRPSLCSFIVPSSIERGPLVLAVSTSGASPAMARTVRKELERLYPPELGRYLARLASFRKKALSDPALSPAGRKRLFKEAGSGDIIGAVRAGKRVKVPRPL
jgi:precorrin-2 dehydrogenase/sirohydrochlorin ferrochelatase